MDWKPVSTIPPWDGQGRQILCRFKGQFGYIYFVARANGPRTAQPGYAAPEEWCEIKD